MIKARLNGVKKEIPTEWDEVSFGKFLQLDNAKESKALLESNAISVFTGIDEETLRNSVIPDLDKLISALSFLSTDVPLFKLPKTCAGYPLPADLAFQSFGQYVDLKTELDQGKTGMELLKEYPKLCAIYTTSPYDPAKAELKIPEFLNAPCTEVLATGNFLLMKLAGLRLGIAPTFQKPDTLLKKLKLVLRLCRSRLAFTLRYYFWNRRRHLTGTN